jgi:hypothetical protein
MTTLQYFMLRCLPAATAQLIALLHRIPPPNLKDIAKSARPTASGDYQAIPRAASADTRRSVSVDSFRDRGSGSVAEEEPYKVIEPTIYEDPETQEEMGRIGWWVLGWSFAASAAITVCTVPMCRTDFAEFFVSSLPTFCSPSSSPCQSLISLEHCSALAWQRVGLGGK